MHKVCGIQEVFNKCWSISLFCSFVVVKLCDFASIKHNVTAVYAAEIMS
jgi:hypothetical protein